MTTSETTTLTQVAEVNLPAHTRSIVIVYHLRLNHPSVRVKCKKWMILRSHSDTKKNERKEEKIKIPAITTATNTISDEKDHVVSHTNQVMTTATTNMNSDQKRNADVPIKVDVVKRIPCAEVDGTFKLDILSFYKVKLCEEPLVAAESYYWQTLSSTSIPTDYDQNNNSVPISLMSMGPAVPANVRPDSIQKI